MHGVLSADEDAAKQTFVLDATDAAYQDLGAGHPADAAENCGVLNGTAVTAAGSVHFLFV